MQKTRIFHPMLLIILLLLTGCAGNAVPDEPLKTDAAAIPPEPPARETTAPTPLPTPAESPEPAASAEQAFYDMQQRADNGDEPWRLNPEAVALDFTTQTLRFEGTAALAWQSERESARVHFTKQTGEEIHIDLYQPAVKGAGGIWAVAHWFDENSRLYQVRDLTALPPLFYNDDNVPQPIKEAVREAIVTDWTETFGRHYNVLGFYAEDVTYAVADDTAEVTFLMTLVTQNFYKDPDTVAYIKEAKDNGSINYQQMYDEYNMPKSANVDLKATVALDDSGAVLPDTVQIFSNASVTGEKEYVPTQAANFIISE